MQPKVRSSQPAPHNSTCLNHPLFCHDALKLLPGKAVDFTSVLDGCGAVCDWPANYFYKQLMETYPHAKVSSAPPLHT